MTGEHGSAARARTPAAVAEMFRAALAQQRRGNRAEAARLFEAVLGADPRHVGALCSLAGLRLEQGAPAEGLVLIDRALRERPTSAEAHHARACLLQASGRLADAVASYQRAIALKPDFAAAHSNLGGLYSEQQHFEDAARSYERALAARPEFAEAHNNLGVALLALDRAQAAVEHFAAAIALRPDSADAHANMGSALISLGRLPDACRAFEAAIGRAPRDGRFYLDLAGCRRFTADDPWFAAMRSLAADPAGLSPVSRTELHFALGKAFADTGQFDESFRHFRQGNALKRVNTPYDETAALTAMRRLEALFPADLLRRRAGVGEPSPLPVFVVGMPRSGTTLIEQILASHPRVFGAGERSELHQAAARCAGMAGRPGALFDALPSLADETLRRLGAEYVGAIAALAPDAARIVDKMPGNFLLLGLIALALPHARIIHVRRDPVDTCLSCFTTLFASHQPYACNLAELGRYYRAYAGLMSHWRAVLPPGMLLEVRYEDVVDDLETQARRMVAHCGLEWDERCLRFDQTQRTVQTASRAQVRQPLYRASVGRAKAYGAMLAPLRQALGDAE